MRIIYLNNYHYIRGGSEKVFFAEMEMMNSRGHETIGFARRHANDLPSPYSGYFPGDLRTDSPGISLSALKTAKEIVHSAQARRNLKSLIRHTRPQVAHAHNIYGRLSTSVLDCLAEEGVPVVMTLHDYKLVCPTYNFTYNNRVCEDCRVHRYYRAVIKRCNKRSFVASALYALEAYYSWLLKKYESKVSIFIAPSRFLKNKLIDYGWPGDKIRYVPNFIDHARYKADYRPGVFFLYMGRLSEEKGVGLLIEAFKKIEDPGIGLVIAGDGPLRAALEETSRPDSRIRFAGYLTGPALLDATRSARAVVLPSVCYENAPLSILEAMAYGKPVIGAAIGGIPEMIDDGRNGLLFKPGDVTDLADKMGSMLKLPGRSLADMGMAARKKTKSGFNADSHYERIMDIYRGLAGGHR